MSAKFERRDGFSFIPRNNDITELEETLLNVSFDNQVAYDIMDIQESIKQAKIIKRVCLYNVLLYPMMWTFTRMFFGKEYAQERTAVYKLSMKYLRKKINAEQFTKILQDMMNDGKII